MVSTIRQAKDRILQLIAFHAPGAKSLRVRLHRWRGVKIGQGVWIGYQVLLDTSRPDLISIGDNVIISVRAMLIAHFRGPQGITIENDAFIGPGCDYSSECNNRSWGRGHRRECCVVIGRANDRGSRKPRPPNCQVRSYAGRKDDHGAVLALAAAIGAASVCRAGPFEMIARRPSDCRPCGLLHCDITEALATCGSSWTL